MVTGPNVFNTLIHDEIIRHGGLISFAQFMELALYHPKYGYYNSEKFMIGQEGDFITAPEISPLFAQCFASQCLQIINQLQTKHILELGAGTGRFAGDFLISLKAANTLPDQYAIYEISPVLRKKQAAFLQTNYPDISDRVIWLDTLPSNFKGIILANEVLDALPVHCFRIENQRILERCVAWENNQFIWKNHAPLSKELELKAQQIGHDYALPEGYESEINLLLPSFIASVVNAMTEGVILFTDYGYGQQEYYHPARCHGTLTCFSHHRHHQNPLISPGLQDITAHVDFTTVIETAAAHGCTLAGYTTQAAFLLSCDILGIAARLETNLNAADAFKLHHAIKLLTMPTEMGERIKVMALEKNVHLPLLGFQLQDRRRELSCIE